MGDSFGMYFGRTGKEDVAIGQDKCSHNRCG